MSEKLLVSRVDARQQTEQLLHTGRVIETLNELCSKPERWRREALESHLVEDIENCEPREKLDEAIWHLGLIELGIQFGVAATPDKSLLDPLRVPEISRYAFQFYPQMLPEMLYHRLRGGIAIAEGQHAEGGQFAEVLQLCARLDAPGIDLFLSSLDDFSSDEVPELRSVLKRLRKPDKVLTYLSAQASGNTPLDRTCIGAFEFLRWTVDLNRLLIMQSGSLAASAIWHQFGYWMNLLGGTVYGAMAATLDSVSLALLTAAPEQTDSAANDRKLELPMFEASPANDEAVSQLRQYAHRLQILTSPRYAAPLFEWKEKAMDEWARKRHEASTKQLLGAHANRLQEIPGQLDAAEF